MATAELLPRFAASSALPHGIRVNVRPGIVAVQMRDGDFAVVEGFRILGRFPSPDLSAGHPWTSARVEVFETAGRVVDGRYKPPQALPSDASASASEPETPAGCPPISDLPGEAAPPSQPAPSAVLWERRLRFPRVSPPDWIGGLLSYVGLTGVIILGAWACEGLDSAPDQTYWYCWDQGDPSPHHLGHHVAGDHYCSSGELREAGF